MPHFDAPDALARSALAGPDTRSTGPSSAKSVAPAGASGRVLVLDGDMVPALTVARSLGRYGLHVDVASHDEAPIAGRSRWARAVTRCPDPLRDEDAFVDWVRGQQQLGRYDLILPVTERSLGALHRHRERVGECTLALPAADALETVLDKSRTLALAAQLGIRVPRGGKAESVERALELAGSVGYPVVLKPVSSIGSDRDARRQLSVRYAVDASEVRARAADLLRFGDVLIQELFQGEGVGVELIAHRGEIVYAFQHLRLHEVPLTGGGSSLRASVAVDPDLLEISRTLIRALGWHGVAMVELKRDRQTGESCLMEINGRFWGSLPLAVAAGADFPVMLYQLLKEGAVAPRPPARQGILCRNLERDLYWLELVLRREAPQRIVELPRLSAALRDLLTVFSPRHRFDIQDWHDPRPGFADLSRIFREHASRVGSLVESRWLVRRQRAAWRNGSMRRRLRKAQSLLFLCYGNINRSALAEHLARERLAERYRLASAGFHPQTGRAADPVMVEIAGAHGIDLSASRSRRIDADLVETADVIFAMEVEHLRHLTEAFPRAVGKAYLLGPAAPDAVPGTGEIPDPYGEPRERYERCYVQLSSCVDALAALTGGGG